MASFVEQNKDFVLKLKIEVEDGKTQVRRVKLPRIADAQGDVSYNELIGLVVTFVFPEADSPDNYQVSLKYQDIDNDDVTVGSADELVDAIEQFADKRILRITTEVRPRIPTQANPSRSTPPAVDQSHSPKQAPETAPPTTSSPRSTAPLSDNSALESLVGALAGAVINLEKGLSNTAKDASRGVTGKAKAVSKGAKAKAQDAAKVARHVSKDVAKTAKNASKDAVIAANEISRATRKVAESVAANVASEAAKLSAANTASKSRAAQVPPMEEDTPRPFIHGRHTCDGCLSTPIVGERYHSVNIDDYDLCKKCFNNYKGDELKFEVAEPHPRDTALQDRWWTRHAARQTKMRKASNPDATTTSNEAQNNKDRFAAEVKPETSHRPPYPPHPRHCPPPPPTHFHCAPPGHPHHPPPPPGHPHHPPPHRFWGGPPRPPHFLQQHHAPHFLPHVHHHLHGVPGADSEYDQALKEAIRRSLQDATPKEEEKQQPAEVPVEKETPQVETLKPSPPPPPSAPVEQDIVIEAKVVAASAPPAPTAPVEALELVEATIAQEDEKTAVTSPASVDETEPDIDFSKTETIERSATADVDSNENAVDDSFASDAVGSGDVAEAMGATLDIMAGVINDMLKEDRDHSEIAADKKGTSDAGATIIDGTEPDASCSDGSSGENEWEVVSEDGGIARAAQMLGSAMFQSDMKSPEDEEEEAEIAERESDEASVVSMASSVPTMMSSLSGSVAHAQRAHWESHLSQLMELGFDDEAEIIDTLERLQAANIGSDCAPEVSVARVINELLEKKAHK